MSAYVVWCLIALVAAGALVGPAPGQAATIFDLTADWSDTVNPNGAWSYRTGDTLLTSTTRASDPWATPQASWGDLPGWFKSNGTELFAHDWQAGDVVTHTGSSDIVWTSPHDGVITIEGSVWHTRDIGRSNDWFIYLNETLLTSGAVGDGTPDSRSAPLSFAAGSGGSSALVNLPVQSADIVRLRLFPTAGSSADYAGVTLGIRLTGQDHYLAYGTKGAKGDICSNEAPPGRIGRSCESEEDCDGTSDPDTGFCVPNKFPKGLRVTISDSLDASTRLYDIKKPVTLYTPADKSGEGVQDPDTHLRGYLVSLTSKRCAADSPANPGGACAKEPDCGGTAQVTTFCQSQPKLVKQINLLVTNQFHSSESPLTLDAVKVDRLLVPTAKGLTESLPPPGTTAVDHYRCYTATVTKGAPKFVPELGVAVKDQFTEVQIGGDGQKLFDLKKVTRLCLAADKNGEGVVNPSAGLLCYQAVPVKGQPKHQPVKGLFLADQIRAERADTTKEEELCVPSVVELPSPS
jgi:hypothetical protein